MMDRNDEAGKTEETQKLSIWVDADACPKTLKEILIKAARRTGVKVSFVANQPVGQLPRLPNIQQIQVSTGFDEADNLIVQRVVKSELVITQDIPLADEVIDKGAFVLGPRGQTFTKENIKSRLNMRDFMETMRSSGIQSGGPAPMNAQDVQRFANELDRWLQRHKKRY
jgi:hypothetical protein